MKIKRDEQYIRLELEVSDRDQVARIREQRLRELISRPIAQDDDERGAPMVQADDKKRAGGRG